MKLRRRFPGCCDYGAEAATEHLVNGMEDFLAIPWIADEIRQASFHQFSIDDSDSDEVVLLAEHDKGFAWYVIGTWLNLESDFGLPVWKPPGITGKSI